VKWLGVRLSVPSFDRSSSGFAGECHVGRGDISRAAAQRTAAKVGIVTLTAELTRLNTDLLYANCNE